MKTPTAPAPVKRMQRSIPAVMATAALLLTATACGPSTASSPSTPSGDSAGQGTGVPALAVNDAAAALLPESIKSARVLRVAIPTNEPPTQFYREGTQDMTGTNPDIARLLGEAWA